MKKKTGELNIRYRSEDPRGRILSNPASTPFTIGQYTFPSVESALQGIKFADIVQRESVFVLSGMEALKAGRKITLSITDNKMRFVYWGREQIEYNSTEHRLLIATFIHEKIRQNKDVQEALLATTDTFIYHHVGIESPHTSLPESFYIEILLKERDLLRMLRSLSLM